jgi:hypothetical protein
MAMSSIEIDYQTIVGQFEEREHGQYFEYRVNTRPDLSDQPFEIFVGPHAETRFGNVLKTVAHVVVDEDANGEPVVEKWDIKTIWAREERGANFTRLI